MIDNLGGENMGQTLELLETLIQFEGSNLGNANDTIDFCKEWLESNGLHPEIITNQGYKMLVCTVGNGKNRLIFNGHVDVVSGQPEQFEPKIKGDKIYGRGSVDMKAGVSAMMNAVSELQNKDLGETSVQLQLVTDEEIGGIYCSSYLTDHGYLGDFVICGEPTQLGIGYKAKGILQADLHFTGKAAHGSRPWEGENAIVKAYKAYEAILDLPFAKESDDLYDGPSINLAQIKGGEAYNVVPDACEMSIDIRYLPKQSKESILKEIQSVTDADIEIHHASIPVDNDINDPHIQLLLSSIEQTTGEPPPKVFGQHGYADTGYFMKHGVPAIEFGPSGANWHGDDEYADIQSVDTYKDILVDFAQRFSDGDTTFAREME
ncbi:putative succinyl-diaminopimelate desuccinylase [Staphylococcus carnosus]|uniref:Succinyl-diaminopimelate desuccinylase n=2 Tax=Staphylococcus carnosus TaxID=1281 RepID=B9DIN7_STACT|nr:putative succinyl-diaminopimelate desuccinylase [Staphylococcus carnosus subsp. carnosus TM300]SUL89163.1 putative succinyl-diaminopimelate desuccinylase [Staphylococcus carnosus]